MMAEMDVGCLITLGGDGTNRAVAVGTNQIPLVAISTGTNNIFPVMVEGTLAGIAAGLVASGRMQPADTSVVSKTLQIHVNGEFRDLALVDVAISRERYVATRAIWDLDTVHEVFLTRAEPGGIGLSSVGGRLHPVVHRRRRGPALCAGARRSGRRPSAEGYRHRARGSRHRRAGVNRIVGTAPGGNSRRAGTPLLHRGPGRRTFADADPRGHCGDSAGSRNGPPVVLVQRTLRRAAQLGLFNLP